MPADKLKTPFTPMEAVSVDAIPEGDNWQYEPKWDGFRCLAFRDGDSVILQSKSEKLLTTAFPEIVDAVKSLAPASFVLDGELVISVDGKLSFDHLLDRLTHSASRARKLAAENPAIMFVFDLLQDEEGLLTGQPLSERRERLERLAGAFTESKGKIQLSPATREIAVARKWFNLVGDSMDGIVAKRIDLPYESGTSRRVQKIKKLRTIDCVVGGVLVKDGAVSHLLLGLYDDDGLLNFVGSAPLRKLDGRKLAGRLNELIDEPGFTGKKPGEVRTQFLHRTGEWQPVRPELVAEIQFDHFTAGRFRHGSKFVRWRPDKRADECTGAGTR
ncbi:MAG TPA: ATP-dependent DNA ligase [Blastocatellia bacterium]|nr:ATP-dependent DNA ligase [Blastocatellia bacterium]